MLTAQNARQLFLDAIEDKPGVASRYRDYASFLASIAEHEEANIMRLAAGLVIDDYMVTDSSVCKILDHLQGWPLGTFDVVRRFLGGLHFFVPENIKIFRQNLGTPWGRDHQSKRKDRGQAARIIWAWSKKNRLLIEEICRLAVKEGLIQEDSRPKRGQRLFAVVQDFV